MDNSCIIGRESRVKSSCDMDENLFINKMKQSSEQLQNIDVYDGCNACRNRKKYGIIF